VVNRGDNNVSVFLGNGDGSFQPAANYGTASGPKFAAVADLDGDGDNDMAVSCDLNIATILFNNGDGTFQPPVLIPAEGCQNITASDLDNDNDMDLITASYVHPNPGYACVMLNNGDGTFGAPVYYLATRVPHAVYAADFDDDGDNDLALANRDAGDISVLLNNGDATFEPAINYQTGLSPSSLLGIDFDGDSDLDLVVANSSSDDVHVMLNLSEVSGGPCCEVRGDIDHDGALLPTDAVYFVNWLWRGGPEPLCIDEADVNGNESVDPQDCIYLVSYFWSGGAAPVPCP